MLLHKPSVLLAVLAILPLPAASQSAATVGFSGTATVGSLKRTVQLRLACALSGGRLNALSITLRLSDAETLRPVFDVNPIEGPGGRRVPGELTATTAAGSSRLSFPPNGSAVNDNGFEFSGGFTPAPRSAADLGRAQDLVARLSQAPSRLTWRIGNPSPKAPPIEATVDLTEVDAARLRAAVGPCMRN